MGTVQEGLSRDSVYRDVQDEFEILSRLLWEENGEFLARFVDELKEKGLEDRYSDAFDVFFELMEENPDVADNLREMEKGNDALQVYKVLRDRIEKELSSARIGLEEEVSIEELMMDKMFDEFLASCRLMISGYRMEDEDIIEEAGRILMLLVFRSLQVHFEERTDRREMAEELVFVSEKLAGLEAEKNISVNLLESLYEGFEMEVFDARLRLERAAVMHADEEMTVSRGAEIAGFKVRSFIEKVNENDGDLRIGPQP